MKKLYYVCYYLFLLLRFRKEYTLNVLVIM